MNKKSQAQTVREVFQFSIGVIFLVAIFYFLYNSLIPDIEEYAMTLQLENLADHINYLISEIYKSAAQSSYMSAENIYPMPETLGGHSYFIFFSGDEVCVIINDLDIEQCASLMVDSSRQGVFFSGGDLRINVNYNETYSMITLGN